MEALSEDTFLIRAAGANVTFKQYDPAEVAAMKEKHSLPQFRRFAAVYSQSSRKS